MARALTAVGIALALLLGGLVLAVYLGRGEDYMAIDSVLADQLTRAIGTAQDNGGIVDLRAQARFAWDHVLLVEPGVGPAAISRRLGHPWKAKLGVETGDLILFLRRGSVVRFADYHGRGRFAGFARPFASIPRAQAVWRVRDLVVSPAAQKRQ